MSSLALEALRSFHDRPTYARFADIDGSEDDGDWDPGWRDVAGRSFRDQGMGWDFLWCYQDQPAFNVGLRLVLRGTHD